MTALDFLMVFIFMKGLGSHALNLHASATVLLVTGLRAKEIPLVVHLVAGGVIAALRVLRMHALLRPRILLIGAFVHNI